MTSPSKADAARKLDTIRALLAKAEDPAATKPEAEAFFAKAAELMAKYGIDRALLDAADPTATNEAADRVFTVSAPYAYDKLLLLYSIATALGGRAVQVRGNGEHQLHVFAMGSDLERIDLMFTSLLVQAARFMAIDEYRRPPGDSVKVWKRDWLQGFDSTVRARLRDAERRARQEADLNRPTGGPSTELVLVERADRVARRFSEAYPRTSTSSRSRRVGAGYAQGVAAGQRADLGGTRLGGGRAALGR